MRRLIWKELREKRAWAFALPASTLLAVAMGRSFTVVGQFSALTAWLWLPVAVAALAGTAAYSSEIGGVATFLFSRPVNWKTVLLSKLVCAFILAVLSATIAVVVSRILLPTQYASFASLGPLAIGLGRAIAVLFCAYVAGMVFSVTLPGVFGGVLVLVAVVVLSGVQEWVCQAWTHDLGSYGASWVLGWSVGLSVAAVATARFGLTVSTGARMVRYSTVALAFVFLATALNPVLPALHLGTLTESSFSPNGKMAFVTVMRPSFDLAEDCYLYRLADSRMVPVPRGRNLMPFIHRLYWTNSNEAYLFRDGYLWFFTLDSGGQLKQTKLRIAHGKYGMIKPSPDGRLAMVAGHGKTYYFVDVGQKRKLELVVTDPQSWWWQSDTRIGYTDTKGKRHIVSVVPEAAR